MFGPIHVDGRVIPHRVPKGVGPWINWYMTRGHLSHKFRVGDLRRFSWRRAL